MTKIETALTRLLGITHPILLAPMGSAAGGRLAAAVTHAGGPRPHRLRLCRSRRHHPRTRSGRQCPRRRRLHHLGARCQARGPAGGARGAAGGDHAVVRRPHALPGRHPRRRQQDHLSGANPGRGRAGGPPGCRCDRGAGTRCRRSFGNDARHDGIRAGRGRPRRTDPGGRGRRHCRWPRPGGGAQPRRGGRIDGHPFHRDPGIALG